MRDGLCLCPGSLLTPSNLPQKLPRSLTTVRKANDLQRRSRGTICTQSQIDSSRGISSNILPKAQQALLAAMISIAATLGTPLTAEAKKTEPPPPAPTAYDVRSRRILRSPNPHSKVLTTKDNVTTLMNTADKFINLQELQKIIAGRGGNTGSLLENFKKTVTAPVTGDAVQSSGKTS